MFFSNTQLTAPFYSILFETSIWQFNSSKCSPIMPDEVREHLTRDQECFFSSVHLTHVLQGAGQRTGTAIAEAWFCAQWPIFCCFWDLCLDYLAHYKISNGVSHLFIFDLLVLDRIHDAMCLNKMSRTSSRNIGTQHPKADGFHQTHLECLLLKSSFFSFIWP